MKFLVKLVERGRTEHVYACCTRHATTDAVAKRGPGKYAIPGGHSHWLVTQVADEYRPCEDCEDEAGIDTL